jgi:hypothetical protein
MAEEPTYDWSTAPQEMRAELQRMQAANKDLEEREAKAAARLAQLDRSLKFDELKAAGGDALKDVTLDDIGDLGAEQITPTILQAKALEKGAAREKAETEMAKALGFDSADELRAFRVEAETRNQAKLAAMGNTAAAAMAGQGAKEPIKTPTERAFEEAKALRAEGLPPDEVRAGFIGAKFDAAMAEANKP